MQRWHILFSGQVQGVGFRYTSLRAAQRCDVAGWVKNLPDGRVEMLIEGHNEDLEKMIDEVRQTTFGRIDDHSIQKEAATGEFERFVIRR